MKRYLLIGAVAMLAACSQGDAPVDPAEAVYECPKDKWLANADYADEGKIEASDDFAAYHTANGARKGVVTTDSGLQYKVVQEGLKKGATPVGSQRVEMHYHGFFPDGSIFDSSIDRGETMTHNADGFIKGWNESLADMKVCEARVLYIPGDIAYGPNGRPGIPGNATLLFHMQLLGVKQ